MYSIVVYKYLSVTAESMIGEHIHIGKWCHRPRCNSGLVAATRVALKHRAMLTIQAFIVSAGVQGSEGGQNTTKKTMLHKSEINNTKYLDY